MNKLAGAVVVIITIITLAASAPTVTYADPPPPDAALAPPMVDAIMPAMDAAMTPATMDAAPPTVDLSTAPLPGAESGRIDVVDPGDSTLRIIGRGTLYIPKLLVEFVLLPFRGLVWADDRYSLVDRYYDTFFNADRTIGLYPTATYETGFGASVGLRFSDNTLFGENEQLVLQATTGAITGELYREGALISMRSGDRISHWLQLGFDANFDRRPEDPFYGIGNSNSTNVVPATPIDPRVDTTSVQTHNRYQEARVAVVASAHAPHHLQVHGTAAITDLQFARSTTGVPIDEVYTPAGLVGFVGGVEHAYGELDVRWDTRRVLSEWEPSDVHSAGSLVAAFVGRVHRLDGGVDYSRYGLELQHYWRIASGPRLIAARFRTEAVSGSLYDVPFAELPMLGGADFLRGYSFERFRDRVSAFGSLQYEWAISNLADAYVFTDVGRVYSSYDNLTYKGLRAGFGLGVSVHNETGFLIDVSLASSIDGGLLINATFNPVVDYRERWR